jgi:hypothetical protein
MRDAERGGLHAYFLCLSPCDDAGLALLATIPNVVKVSINWSETVTAKGLAHLSAMPTLRSLYLDDMSAVGEDGLTELKRCKSLEEVQLVCFNGLTDKGVGHLVDVPKLQKLTIHNGAKLSEASIEHFKKMTSLRHLELNYTGLTPKVIERLRKELPDVKVEAGHQ